MPKPIAVRYERLFNLGTYEHVKFATEYQVEDGETVEAVMEHARKTVYSLANRERSERRKAIDAHYKEKDKPKTIKELAQAQSNNTTTTRLGSVQEKTAMELATPLGTVREISDASSHGLTGGAQ
jgi:hypothetical protein